nr:hypothetical protein [Tanacetum cinerariifolium]
QYSELMSKFQAQEEEIGRLKERVQVLEDREAVATKQSGEDAPIKGRSNNEGEAAAERIIMVESDTPKKKKLQEQIDVQVARELEEQQEREDMRMNEQIARDAKVARIHAEEEIQGMIDSLDKSNEIIAKYLQEYQQFASELPMEKKIELISDLVKYQEHYTKKEQVKKQKSSEEAPKTETSTEEFTEVKIKEIMQLVPVEDVYVQALQVKHPIIDWKVHSEGERSYWQIIRLGGSSACYQFFVDLLRKLDREDLNQLWTLVKDYLSIRPASSDKEMELWEETERIKRNGLNLEKEQVKKQKSSEEAPEIETSTEEFTEEKMKKMSKPFMSNTLSLTGREDLNQLWTLVKEYLSIRPATSDKEMELWVELKRMYKPDPEDQLWTLTRNFIACTCRVEVI